MNTKKLMNIIKMQEDRVFNYVKKNVPSDYEIVVDTDMYCFMIPKEHNGICLVAHIDTVRTAKMNKTVKLVKQNGIIWNQNGILGADDRAGIFACLELARMKGPKPLLLFTNLEEVGGIGVGKFIEDAHFEDYKSQVNLFIELDRKGINEYVSYCELNKDLEAIMSLQGYHEEWGSYSDVCDLSNAYGISHVNLGVGYFHQHTNNEFLSIDGLQFAINACANLMKCIDKQYLVPVKKTKPFMSHYEKKTVKKVKKSKAVMPVDYGYYGNMDMSGLDMGIDPKDDFPVCPNCGGWQDIVTLTDNKFECHFCGVVFDSDGKIEEHSSTKDIIGTHF